MKGTNYLVLSIAIGIEIMANQIEIISISNGINHADQLISVAEDSAGNSVEYFQKVFADIFLLVAVSHLFN